MKTFSKILNWYVKRNIDEGWDLSKVSFITDSVAMTRLLGALPTSAANEYYRTFVIVRPFPALVTDLRFLTVHSEKEWLDYFTHRRDQQRLAYEKHGGEPSWLIGQDLQDDPFVRMCQGADYASFYFGRADEGGEPQLTLPRFEFMDSLRKLTPDDRRDRVRTAVDLVVAGIHATKWTQDREHNFMTQRQLPRLVPFVVYEAHEKCKALGHKLESELLQAITMRLSELKAMRGLPVPRLEIEPVPLDQFMARLKRIELPPSDE